MQNRIKDIEFLYQSQLTSLNNWRERELTALAQEDSTSLIIIPPPAKFHGFDWNGTEDEIKLVHQFFLDEKIMPNISENSLSNFTAHLYNITPTFNKIKLANTKKALWCFFILQNKKKITDKDLFDVLPSHCSKVFANGKEQELKRKNISSELWEMRDTKPINYPDYVNELLLILKLKS